MPPRAPHVLLAMLSLGLLAAARAQGLPASEYQAKAAFLYNFTKYVEWPARAFAGPGSPIRLCIVGDAPFDRYLDAVGQRRAHGRPLSVSRLPAAAPLSGCHVLFVSASEADRYRQILAEVKDEPVLTVGEIVHFAENGGVINLLIEDHRVGMEVNIEAAERHGLELSSHLLRLARPVGGEPGA